MNSDSTLILDEHSDSLIIEGLSIALIGPDEPRRKAASSVLAKCQGGVIREFSTYPPSMSDVPKLLEQSYDVIIIDLDSRPEYALQLVENICAHGTATVMVYSMKADSDLLVRCMRAGAREFLTLPFVESTVTEALVRAAVRRPPTRPLTKKAGGRLMVFLGAKGGDGVTTLACNFAVSMAKESGQSTLLIDLDLPLGDAALNLGVVAEYSTINALQNAARLDSAFLSKLLVKHSTGVFVLAAPGKFPQFDASHEAIDKLIAVARQDFDNIVIDIGSRLDLMGTSLFKDGSTVYLVIQAGIAGLRNSNRLISQYFATGVPKLEIVLNRFQSRTLGVAEDQIAKALTRPAQWKIPNDYSAVRRMQHTAVPLALEDSPISRLIRQMARAAAGLPPISEKSSTEKSSGFSLKHLGRSFTSKLSSSEEQPAVVKTEPEPALETAVAPALVTPVHAAPVPVAPAPASPAEVPAKSSVEAGSGSTAAVHPTAEVQPPPTEPIEITATQTEPSTEASAPAQPNEPETRTYRGATYVKGADGKWYLQKADTESASTEEAEKPQTPVITWPAPAPISYGTKLSALELNATASVPGKFVYDPAEGEELAVGEHTLTVVFTPEDTKGYTAAEATIELAVTKAEPAIEWAAPAPIVYGAALNGAQLNATASVPGEFAYTPAAGEVLAAGEHTLSVSFTPADTASYESVTAAVQFLVDKAIPAINWAIPASIQYSVALDGSQLNATASVPGEFAYRPAAGEVLAAGEHTLWVSFTPADTASYESATAAVQISVTQAIPAITWSAPAPIPYGTALDDAQLNATASIPGEFVYTPAAGEVLAAGEHTLSVVFTPADSTSYTTAEVTVQISVAMATPVITWNAPVPIAYGAALGALQLNATASVPGEFVYTPALGEVLLAGEHTLSVSFTPQDTDNYTDAEVTVPLMVTKATPIILWATAEPIAEGTPLSSDQLNATALVEGSFEYSPAMGEVLSAGTHTLSVTFTPKAAEEYNTVQASMLLTVTEAAPVIEELAPAPAEDIAEIVSSPLDAAPEPSTSTEEESEAALIALETASEEAPTESAVEAEVTPTVEPAIELAAEPAEEPVEETVEAPLVEVVEARPVEAAAETDVEAEAEPVAEAAAELVAEPVPEPVAEAVETVAEEAPVEMAVEAEAEPSVEAPSEPVVESVVEAVTADQEEASDTEAEAEPTVDVPAKPVTEPVVVAADAAPLEAPAVPIVEVKAAEAETVHEAPEQALVKIPPPKFTFEAGSGLNLMGTAVFPDGTTIYLVMQPGSGGHVDSQRLVSQFLSGGELKPEIVINRYEPRTFNEDEEQAAEDLAQAENLSTVPRMDATVQSASKPGAVPEKKKGFSLKGLRKSLWAKVSSNEKTEGFTQLGLKPEQETKASTRFGATAQVRVNSEIISSAAPLPVEEPKTPVTPVREAEAVNARQEETYSAPAPQVETRTYQGATYVKGADGKWHLQQTPSRTEKKETPPAPAPVQAEVPVPAESPVPVEEESAPTAADPISETPKEPIETAPVQTEAAPVQAEPVPVVAAPVEPIELPTPAVPIEAEPLPAVPLQTEPQAIETEAPTVQDEEQAPVEVEEQLASVETALPLSTEPIVPEIEVEPRQEVAEVASEPPVENQVEAPAEESPVQAELTVKGSPIQAEKPARASVPSVKAPEQAAIKAKAPVKAAAKAPAKSVVKPKITVKAAPKPVAKAKPAEKAAAKPAVKTKKAVKAPPKPAAKAKKIVKVPAKTAAKAKKPVKVTAKPKAKAALKSGKIVKAPVKAAAKGGKPVKRSLKAVVKVAPKAKKPIKTVSKAQVKATVRKTVKSPAKPVAKKKAAKAPARKPAKKR